MGGQSSQIVVSAYEIFGGVLTLILAMFGIVRWHFSSLKEDMKDMREEVQDEQAKEAKHIHARINEANQARKICQDNLKCDFNRHNDRIEQCYDAYYSSNQVLLKQMQELTTGVAKLQGHMDVGDAVKDSINHQTEQLSKILSRAG